MSPLEPVPEHHDPDLEVWEGDLGDEDGAFQGRAARVGAEFKHLARDYLLNAGAMFVRDHHMVGSYRTEGVVAGPNGQRFLVLAHGCVDDGSDAGLRRSDTVKKAGYDAHQLRKLRELPILLVTSHLPRDGTVTSSLLADCAEDLWDVLAVNGDLAGYQRLNQYLHTDPFPGRLPAPWRSNPSRYEPELFDLQAAPGGLVEPPIDVEVEF